MSQSPGISGPTTTWLGVLGRQVVVFNVFWPAQSRVWEASRAATSPKSSTVLWCERDGCCLFFVCPLLPSSWIFSFLSLSSFCVTQAQRGEPRHAPFHSAAVILWPARQGKAVPCATWRELPGVGGADNSHFCCLFPTVMKLQASVTGAALSVCALLFFLLLTFFSAKIRTGFQKEL